MTVLHQESKEDIGIPTINLNVTKYNINNKISV